MIGKLGTTFGRHSLNIELAAVGHRPEEEEAPPEGPYEAVMAVTTDQPVPREVLDEIVSEEGFVAARFVSLAGTLG
jgi:hypothetical protein